MVEIIVERWSHRDRHVDFLWSVWKDGRRVEMGGPLADAAAAEEGARKYCREAGLEVDRVTRL